MTERAVVITGMGVFTRLGDTLGEFYENLLAGHSGITRWGFIDDPRVYSKVGGDLSDVDLDGKLDAWCATLAPDHARRLRKLWRTAPFSTRCTLLVALSAWDDAGRPDDDPLRQAVIVAGHNLNERYLIRNQQVFLDEPDYIAALSALLTLDTDHAASVGELLSLRGATYTMGGACASGNIALRAAVDEIRHHGHSRALVVGAALDFSPMGLHAMALMGAITFQSFNDAPQRASRPYDVDREGFVPSHGAACLVLEEREHARARGARIYAEVLGCVATADGCHLPSPSTDGQAATMSRVLEEAGVPREEVGFVSAHATSTPLGDLSELRAIHQAFGSHADRLKINAPKSLLGHTCWAAPTVETVAAILQLRHGRLHPSINIDQLDPAVDLDVCANEGAAVDSRYVLKNAFGFGGLNCCALFGLPDA